jgi:peptidoglycan lytic transglycosylase
VVLRLILVSLVIACSTAALAQPGIQKHTALRAALDRYDLATAENLLRDIQRSSPGAFTRNNYDYLLARIVEERGERTEAVRIYEGVADRSSVLAPYALWHEAGLLRSGGDLTREQQALQKLVAAYPGYLLRTRALERLGDSYFKSANYAGAMRAFAQLGPRRDALAKTGEAQLALKQNDAARASFESVLTSGLIDDASLRAALGLDRLDSALPATSLTEASRLKRARLYQVNRYFADARRHWMALLKDHPQSEHRAEILFQLGRGYFLEDNFSEAIKWYERVHTEFPQTDEGEQGYYFVGHCYQFLNDPNRAIARYEQFLKAYLNAIDTLRSAGRLDEALKWAGRGQTGVRESFIVTTALFQQAKIKLTQENYSGALADLTVLRSRNLSLRGMLATTNIAEVNFLRAYCLEKQGRFEEAVNEYLALAEVRSGAAGYYGHRASEHLKALETNARGRNMVAARHESFLAQARSANSSGNAAAARIAANQALRFTNDEATSRELLNILRNSYSKLPGYHLPVFSLAQAGRSAPIDEGGSVSQGSGHDAIARELLFLGLYDEGAPELAVSAPAGSRDGLYSIAVNCARGGCANRTIKFSEPILNGLPEDFRPELLPSPWNELFYPTPYREAFEREGPRRGVDPRFMLSIARQESRYDPTVKSNAAARGLMQFIPSTGSDMAAKLGIEDFTQSDLFNPEVSVKIGAQYMQDLFTEFHEPQAVAAAYNGSEISVRRWLARAKSSDVDRFVAEVAKSQTKDYVYRVMGYFWAYERIYPRMK